MSKAPYKLPNVFVGCPYGGKFKFDAFKSCLEKIPFRFFYADTRLQTKHLMEILRKYIATADFCIFDISTWNPNVALELGLADGMDAEYYILLNRKLSQGVPADIQGIQRIEYANYRAFDENNGLLPLLVRYIVRGEHTHPRNIWDSLEGDSNREKKYYFALRVLAHFKEHKRLSSDHLTTLSRGTYLRKLEKKMVLDQLASMGLISNVGSQRGAQLKKRIFRDPIR
jgi:hypothetical protein